MSRWLVASTSWGVLSTSDRTSKTPNGGVKSHSDYVAGAPTGRVFLYLSPMDVSTQDLMVDARSSFTVSEAQLARDGPLASSGAGRREAGTAAGGGGGGGGGGAAALGSGLARGSVCHGMDPEDPTCAKVSLVGTTLPVPDDGPEWDVALAALFARHPAMADWPAGHQFAPYELHVREAHLLDWYGGMKIIPRDEYYAYNFTAGVLQGQVAVQ